MAVRVGKPFLQQLQRRGIHPLEIVQKEREGVFALRKHPKEAREDEFEPILRLNWTEIRDRWLRAEHAFQFRNDVDEELRAGSRGGRDAFPPRVERALGLRQQLTNQAAEGLSQA